MGSNDEVVVQNIRKYAEQALMFISGMSFADFSADTKTIAACAMVLGQIGEQASKLSSEFETNYPQIRRGAKRRIRTRCEAACEGAVTAAPS